MLFLISLSHVQIHILGPPSSSNQSSTPENQPEMSRWKQRELQMLRRGRIQVQICFFNVHLVLRMDSG